VGRLKPVVLKLGGSVVTDKMVPFKIRDDVIAGMASELAQTGRTDLIIIHGGGSVGHYLADKLNLLGSEKIKPMDSSYVLLEMDKLSTRIASHLIEKGIPAVTLPTHAIGRSANDGEFKLDESNIKLALDLGFSPLLKGDVVFGEKGNVDIVSGDALASRLAISFGAERLVMCMDQDGIIGPDSKLLDRVKLSEPYDRLLWPSEEGRIDVTGGLGAKLKELESVVKRGIPVLFLCPFRPNRLFNAISGKPFRGTEVVW
jgi:isopentenyl phosphate kinase